MSKVTVLIDTAIAAAAKKQKRLKRTIRKHILESVVSLSIGKLNLTDDQVGHMLDGKLNIDPQSAILLAGALGVTAREILDAQTDDYLSSAGDLTSRDATVKETPVEAAPVKPGKVRQMVDKVVTRTSPMAPSKRRNEITE